MSATDRQNRLLVAEDWKRIYQTFQNADFQSYDFESLRRVMIGYIRENYPEDFNDYIESSEYLALIDLIAFLGQSLAFRVDLNARDNFLELAERRESVLRLARLLSYKVKRNIAASGLLKISTISTSQDVYDSNGRNLSGQIVSWNDPANPNWYDQFIKVTNAALPSTRQFGNSEIKDSIYGIPTEQYRFQTVNTEIPVYGFSKSVDGRTMDFEIVSTTFAGKSELYEEPPKIGNNLAFIYRDDGKGSGSSNTGFFMHFRQGSLNQGTFSLSQPTPDETVDIDAANINNSDVWLYRLDKNGLESELWEPVPNFEDNNIIYNSIKKDIKNIYGVLTRSDDRVSLIFSDGLFGNLPQGSFRSYYRTSNGLSYTINPKDIKNVSISIPYVSSTGQLENLTISLSLQTAVSNSSAAESSNSIKTNAPATYYTQNRMITGEDYNISPLKVNQEVVKVKSINRSSSGISRYFDLVDPTGKYSKTNLFADDGVIYRQFYSDSFKFKFSTRTDIEGILYNQVTDILQLDNLKNFYYSNFTRVPANLLNVAWNTVTIDTNQTTGFITDIGDTTFIQKTGVYTSSLLSYFVPGALVKFTAPIIGGIQHYFDRNNNNSLVTNNNAGTTRELWSKVIFISGDGSNLLIDGSGPVILNDVLPSGSIISEIIPAWRTSLDSGSITSIVELIFSNKPFGLRYDTSTLTWKIITETNLNTLDGFSLGRQGDASNQKIDASWLLLFNTDTEFYTVSYRLCRYVFESDKQVRFYFDSSDKIYDTRTNTVVTDSIKVLGINSNPRSVTESSPFTYDRNWEILREFHGLDGYVDSKKIEVTFSDSDADGVVDDPDIFEQLVYTDAADLQKRFIIQEKYTISQGQEDYRYISNSDNIVIIADSESAISLNQIADAQCVYFIDKNVVKRFSRSTSKFLTTTDYRVFVGRGDLKFQYIHNADYETRIDPGLTNLIDVFVLTKQYDIQYRQWVLGSIDTEPLPPSSDFLYNLLSPDLNKIKSISDEIIYHPVKYKILFGPKAISSLQATFKVVKNTEVVVSDNDIKTRVLSSISEFFALENWEFGDNFYFSELSAYVMNSLAPDIVNFTIVPKQNELSFGSLYEIRSEKDQIFINGATIDDIEIISTITASNIRSGGPISLSNTVLNRQSINSSGSK